MEERTSVVGPTVELGPGLGVMLPRGPSASSDWSTAADEFARLERHGCSAIWITDHLFWGVDVPEALAMAGVAVGATRRCAIGTGVLQLPLRHPAVVAKAASTLQHTSGGRFLLGIGSGEHRREYELAGADFDRRGQAVDDGLAHLRELWAPGDTPYEQRPAPATMPLWFGGRSRATMRRVATWGQGWLPIFSSPARVAEGVAALEPLLVAAGRARADLTIGATVIAAVTDSTWTRREALRWMADLWGVPAERFDRHLVSGTAEHCAEALHAYVESGADHVTVLPASPEPVATYVALTDAFRPGRVPGPDQLAGV